MATRDPARRDRADGLEMPRSLVAASRRDATKNSRGPSGSLSCTRASALLVATVVRTPGSEVPSPHIIRGHRLRVAQSACQSSSGLAGSKEHAPAILSAIDFEMSPVPGLGTQPHPRQCAVLYGIKRNGSHMTITRIARMGSRLIAFPCRGHGRLGAAALGISRGLGDRAEARLS